MAITLVVLAGAFVLRQRDIPPTVAVSPWITKKFFVQPVELEKLRELSAPLPPTEHDEEDEFDRGLDSDKLGLLQNAK